MSAAASAFAAKSIPRTCWSARRRSPSASPIKWIEDRREHLIAANHSRQQHHRVRAAIDAEGHILAIDNEFFHDNGAYMRTHAATVPDLAAAMLPGPYRVPAYRAAGHIRLTNKTPCGTYRAPGRYESTFVRERLMDAIAAKVGVDKVEIRRRNLIAKSAMPYALGLDTLGTHIVYDSGDYALLLDKALQAAGWDALQTRLKARRAKGEKVGAGLALFVEKSGLGPFDTVRIEARPDGTVEVITGDASVGQGIETVIAQICAETLGVDYAKVRVIHGQTDRIERGMGAFASRVTVMCGEATRLAATKLREAALREAATLMQTDAAALDIVDGVIHGPGPSMPLGELARALPRRLERRGHLRDDPYGLSLRRPHRRRPRRWRDRRRHRRTLCHRLRRRPRGEPEAGRRPDRRRLRARAGRRALEEFLYDDSGEPLSVTFADYLMPTAHEIPEVSVLIAEDAPSPLNPLGLKGAGEGGTNPVGAAIASAIDDALQRPGAVTRLPVSPQRLKAIMAGRR